MAIVYDSDGGITVYREGGRYAETIHPWGHWRLQTYPEGEADVLLGQRLTGAVNGFLTGGIRGAAFIDCVLTADEVTASYRAGVIHYTAEIGVEQVPGTVPGAARSIEGQTPRTPRRECHRKPSS